MKNEVMMLDKFDIEEIIKHKNERLLKKWVILLLDSLIKGDEDKNELAYFPDDLITIPLELGWQEPYHVLDKDLDEALNVMANFEGDSQQEAIRKSKTLITTLKKTTILCETNTLIPQEVRKKHGFDIRTILKCHDEKKLYRLTLYLLESFIKNDIDHKAFSRYPEDLVIIPLLVFQKNSFKVQDKNLRDILNKIGDLEYLNHDKALELAHQMLKTSKKIMESKK